VAWRSGECARERECEGVRASSGRERRARAGPIYRERGGEGERETPGRRKWSAMAINGHQWRR
jgi:hypothetical protein